MQSKPRLLRITTVPISLKLLLRGQVNYFQKKGFEVLTVSAGGSEVNELLTEGIPHQLVPMTRKITPIQDLICLWKLIRVIHTFKPDIVHTHTPKAGLLGMIAAWLCRVPARFHTVAGLPLMESKGFKRSLLKVTERITYYCAHRVYPNSKGLLEFIVNEFQISDSNYQTGVDSSSKDSKFQIIGRGSSNGIDTLHFFRTPELLEEARAIRVRYQIPEGTIVFSFVGRIVRDKGIVELVEAFKRISTSQDVRLMLVGSFEQDLDPLPDKMIQFINDSRLVIKAGFQPDVRPWLLASDAFVFPSYREGFPNVVMQAACLEIPSIVSDINGCNEIIEDKVSGLIVPPKNVHVLFDAMLMLAKEKDKRLLFGSKARQFVIDNFDQQHVWEEIYKEYTGYLG
jgi:glycosyltransferase involved in cell wall biosynthesis